MFFDSETHRMDDFSTFQDQRNRLDSLGSLNDNLQSFDTQWDETIIAMRKLFGYDIL